MNQQDSTTRVLGIEFEATVVVDREGVRVGCATAAVARQRIFRSGAYLRIDFVIQFLEQSLLQSKVVVKGREFVEVVLFEFFIEVYRVPQFELA